MKKIIFALLLMYALDGFSQTSEMIVEEKSSAWIKVTASITTPVARKPASTTQKRVTTKKPAPSKSLPDNQQFDKTNQQVNRFKKKGK